MQDEGHQVGNHTWSHVRLEGADPEMLLQEIHHNEALLQEILGGENYWLRPPYGVIAPELERLIQVPMIKWSVDPRDWESRDSGKIVEAVLAEAKPNSIILMHDIYPASVDAALELVDRLQQEGYWFVTVEELLKLNGVEPQKGVMYRTGA
jgi:peptidoglycan/xylan/chitin deacetylase (PgdA/CDA1 family)